MGYQLHITRAPEWSEAESYPIRHDEWLHLVDQDRDLAREACGLPGFVLWTGWPRGGDHPPMWYSEGEVDNSDTYPPVIRKLHQLAQLLGARVVGDDDEKCDATDKASKAAAAMPRDLEPPEVSRPWCKCLLGVSSSILQKSSITPSQLAVPRACRWTRVPFAPTCSSSHPTG